MAVKLKYFDSLALLFCRRWRIYLKKIHIGNRHAEQIVKATVVLHNLLQARFPKAVHSTAINGQSKWQPFRSEVKESEIATSSAIEVREKFKEYFNHHGKVSWQYRMCHLVEPWTLSGSRIVTWTVFKVSLLVVRAWTSIRTSMMIYVSRVVG